MIPPGSKAAADAATTAGEGDGEVASSRASEPLSVVAAAFLYRVEGTDDPRAVPVIVSAPRPARHHNLFALAGSPDDQGFLLSDGTFADRKRAAEIALASGQCVKLTAPPRLYSEDLW